MDSHGPNTVHENLHHLDLIEVASPCHVPWEEMTGDERVRFCRHCKLNVYDLSEMSREEGEAFVSSREGRTCVRFYRRLDGTVLTRDCPVGVRALRQRFVRAAAALAGVLVAMLGGTLFGGVLNRFRPSGLVTPSEAFANWIDPQPTGPLMLGVMYSPNPAPNVQPPDIRSHDPAETPLLPPTPEQLQQIQQRLEQ